MPRIDQLSMQNIQLPAVLATFALLASVPVAAREVHGVSVEAGAWSEAKLLRIGVQRHIERTWFRSERYHLGAYWDLSVGAWRGDAFHDRAGSRQDLWDIGLTPTFRYQRHDRRGLYAEGGIGVHYLSEVWDNSGKSLSTRFQFGDHFGAGYVFDNGLDLGFRFQHHSNGGIKKPNDGANFLILRAAFPF